MFQTIHCGTRWNWYSVEASSSALNWNGPKQIGASRAFVEFYVKMAMHHQSKLTFVVLWVLLACILVPGTAKAASCQADRTRNTQAGETVTISVKVRRGAACQYSFHSARYEMHGVQVIQKPPSARVITNNYAVAYSFSQVGSYSMKIRVNRSDGSFFLIMKVEVVADRF